MNEHWLEITQGGHMHRHSIGPGRTSVGGGAAEIALKGVGEDQLQLVPEPWRVTFKGTGPAPFCDATPLSSRPLESGTRIEWAGILIEFRSPARLQELPSIELEAAQGSARGVLDGQAQVSELETNAWHRVRAGLLVDCARVDRATLKHWQEQVLTGELDYGACAAELNAAAPALDFQVLERAGRLMRDFLMASKLRGSAGVARASRMAAKSFLGMLLSQLIAIGIYSLIVLGCMVFIRQGGYSFDGLCDSILGVFGLK